jgi:hypothetical protein
MKPTRLTPPPVSAARDMTGSSPLIEPWWHTTPPSDSADASRALARPAAASSASRTGAPHVEHDLAGFGRPDVRHLGAADRILGSTVSLEQHLLHGPPPAGCHGRAVRLTWRWSRPGRGRPPTSPGASLRSRVALGWR